MYSHYFDQDRRKSIIQRNRWCALIEIKTVSMTCLQTCQCILAYKAIIADVIAPCNSEEFLQRSDPLYHMDMTKPYIPVSWRKGPGIRPPVVQAFANGEELFRKERKSRNIPIISKSDHRCTDQAQTPCIMSKGNKWRMVIEAACMGESSQGWRVPWLISGRSVGQQRDLREMDRRII